MNTNEETHSAETKQRSNLASRVLVGAAAGPLIFFSVIFSEYAFLVIAFLILASGLWEIYRLIASSGEISFTRMGWIYGCALYAASVWCNFMCLFYLMLIGLFIFASGMIAYKQGGGVFGAALTYFWTIYLAAGIGSLILFHSFPWSIVLESDAPYAAGRLVSFVFLSVWTLDTAAYFIGKRFGKRPFAHRVSPKKTLEGAVGGFLCTMLMAVAAHYIYLRFFPIQHVIALGCLVGILGQAGDLVLSAFKRRARIKDSSSIIPGHGGVLDRFDSLFFVSPFIYFYAYFMF